MKPRILLVDDHALLRRGVESIVKRHALGTVCGEAEDGLEAIRKVQELQPDLVIMDVSMPKMNGVEATREIRRLAPQVKIIVLTTHDTRQMAEIVKESGADGFVAKTAAEEQLVDAVCEVFGKA